MTAKLGSFRHSFAERREREKLLPTSLKETSAFWGEEGKEDSGGCFCFRRIGEKFTETWRNSKDVFLNAWEMGLADPRKVVFSAKMGLALMLISLLIFFREPLEELSNYSVWAILTVVVVFEFSIGATLSKGFNRGLGTLTAGGLALGTAELCELAGDWEEAVIVASIFLTGFVMTYAKLYPTMKPYEYGFRVFLITYCFIMVSGYQTREFVNTAVTRFLLIALGAGVSLAVNICIYPIWAGEDLHNLVSKNFTSLATSLEGCVNGYLKCANYARVPSKILTYQASDDPIYSGYRSTVESTSQEEALIGFAIWEPPHGPYKMFKYPWRDYAKVGGALRHCTFTVMALHGCILSEIQAPIESRLVFSKELQRVGTAGAKVLRELGRKLKNMEKLGSNDILYEVQEAAEKLQKVVDQKSYLLVCAENWRIGHRVKELKDAQEFAAMEDEENVFHSLNYSFPAISKSWTADKGDMNNGCILAPPVSRLEDDSMLLTEEGDEESNTYQNASRLALATFMSLMIEFVARLQNLVDSFEELSIKANFKEVVLISEESLEEDGMWTKLLRGIQFGRKEEPLLV
ncbi:aluminum-activated malate transporter 9-like [Impatiens glandulifera]|uniref:aluminum-activated malate transporter 9-like n=1 Tax=Impatiens glandulifera TaxID=253017 RepID=UPI001FB0EF43|nr:aluminum-activated malate transporter 9-like [Impatiens glandulifera]XP_047315890.1 aluminum-activated malate transporter 9-like [Impatiens glandulifera]